MLENSELQERCQKFLKDSSSFYSTQQTRIEQDVQMYSGNFWDESRKKEFYRVDRPCETWNLWKVFCNAISSPYSSSPYHIELESKNSEELEQLQSDINAFEARNDVKNNIIQWLSDATVSGQAVATISIIDKSEDDQEIRLELIDDMSCVALDPSIKTTSGADAEEGAIVNFISLTKAKRLYGEDVVGYDFPNTVPPMCDIGAQWAVKATEIPIVNYYYKDDDGKVVFSQLCGLKVLKHTKMPYSTIPIIRITGYKVRSVDRKQDYIGVVRATYSLQLGANVGYSTLIERMNRSPKGNFLMPVGAVEGLEEYYKIAGSKESLLYLYNGSIAPTPIVESFQTADLAQTVDKSAQLMSNVLGIPLTGINGLNFDNKTATEVLVQQTNAQSNVSCFYTSTYEAIRTVGRILIELAGFDGESIVFKLENGPDVITRNAKKRQELSLLLTMVPENLKPLIAIRMAETLDDTMAEGLAKDITANLDPSVKIVSEGEEDPNAVHILNGMKASLDNAMDELSKAKQTAMELKQQNDMLQLQMMNMKSQQALDMQKFLIEQQNKMKIESAKLMSQGVKIDNDAKAQEAKAMNDAEKVDLEKQKLVNEAMKDTTIVEVTEDAVL